MYEKATARYSNHLLLVVFAVFLWQYKTHENDKLESMCNSSVSTALKHFEEFEAEKDEADYIAGVAEFHTYMTAYLCLKNEGNTDYIWCNILYGDMILHPEKVKAHIAELVDALAYLAQDYDHPNGFNRINELNNQLKSE